MSNSNNNNSPRELVSELKEIIEDLRALYFDIGELLEETNALVDFYSSLIEEYPDSNYFIDPKSNTTYRETKPSQESPAKKQTASCTENKKTHCEKSQVPNARSEVNESPIRVEIELDGESPIGSICLSESRVSKYIETYRKYGFNASIETYSPVDGYRGSLWLYISGSRDEFRKFIRETLPENDVTFLEEMELDYKILGDKFLADMTALFANADSRDDVYKRLRRERIYITSSVYITQG